MTTIGGVAFRHLDHLPRVGDSISVEGIILTVLEMDEHRIARVRVSRGAREEESVPGNIAGVEGAGRADQADGGEGKPVDDSDLARQAGIGNHVDGGRGAHDRDTDRASGSRPAGRNRTLQQVPGDTTMENAPETGKEEADQPHKLAR